MPDKTKNDIKLELLRNENAKLEAEVSDMKESLDESTSRIAKLDEKVQQVLDMLPEEDEQSPKIQDMAVIIDPFENQDPHVFLAEPPGLKLGWLNPVLREQHTGWRGWVAVSYDDPIGMELDKYMLDPPHRVAHSVDNLVRRGDVVLAVLPIELWEKRRQEAAAKANRAQKAVEKSADQLTFEQPREDGTFAPLPADNSGEHIGGSRVL